MIYSDIENMTNAEAVAYFGPITRRPLPCGDLENLLDWAGLAKRNPITGAFEGSLIDFMNSQAVPALSDGLAELFSHLNKPRSIGCDTHEQPWASKMADLLSGLEAAGQIDPSVAADVVDLGGGYAYPGLDDAAVQLVRDEALAAQAAYEIDGQLQANDEKFWSLYNQNVAPLKDAREVSGWKAAIQAMADGWVE